MQLLLQRPPAWTIQTVEMAAQCGLETGLNLKPTRRMGLGKPYAGKPLVRFDEGEERHGH